MTAYAIDWSSVEAIRAFVSRLDSGQRSSLTTALRDADSTDNTSALLEQVREHLAENPSEDGEAIGVLFTTMNYDNGDYLSDFATVLYANGEADDSAEFGALVNETMTEEYGRVASGATLAVDLRTGELDYEDSDDGKTIWERFAVPEPLSTTWRVTGGRPTHTMAHVTADTEAEAMEHARHVARVARYLAAYPDDSVQVTQLTTSQARRV